MTTNPTVSAVLGGAAIWLGSYIPSSFALNFWYGIVNVVATLLVCAAYEYLP